MLTCKVCEQEHRSSPLCERLSQVTLSLDLYAALAFVTDSYNRFVWVNRAFASAVGDPVRDNLSPDMRSVQAAMVGPYRDRFPRGRQEVAACLVGIEREVEKGVLESAALRLVRQTRGIDGDIGQFMEHAAEPWDGTVIVRDKQGKTSAVREHVVPLANAEGKPSGYHISLWLPAEKDLPADLAQPVAARPRVVAALTPRQLEIARYYASGLSSRGVALKGGVTHRTARDHLEEIYSRLDVHSRAELVALLVREGLA